MKVLHVCAVVTSVELLLRPQIDDLTSRGLEVESVCSPDERVAELREHGYTIHEVPVDRTIAPVGNTTSVARLTKLIRRGRYDLVHTHSPVASVVGRVAAKLAGVERIVYTAHGFYFHDLMPRRSYRFYSGVERSMAKITDRVLVQSREDFDIALAIGIGSPDTVRYLGNGVDIDRFTPVTDDARRTEMRRSLGVPDHAGPVLVVTGRITEEKGYGELVTALATLRREFPEIHLVVIGGRLASERDDFRRTLHQMIDRHHLQPNVTFTGFRSDVGDVLGVGDLFVLPSYREGLPRSVIEAMAVGLPVVATDIRGCREAVVDGTTGLLAAPRDADALASVLGDVLRDPDRAVAFGRAGRARAVECFDERMVFQRIADAYEELGVPVG